MSEPQWLQDQPFLNPRMEAKRLPGGVLEPLDMLKASRAGLGSLLGRPGRHLGHSWSGLGSLLSAAGHAVGALKVVLGGIVEADKLPK